MEHVLAERDSEDEVDDDVADLEDRRVSTVLIWYGVYIICNFLSYIFLVLQMLDDFVDVSKDEKQMMHLWNSFVRKQR